MGTLDRHSEGYVPQFDIDAEFGRQGELIVMDIIDALKRGAVEVKTDEIAGRTGNVYVEYRCKGRASGIQTSEAEVWVFVVGEVAIAVPRVKLERIAYALARRDPSSRKSCLRGSHPTDGIAVPIPMLFEEWL